MQSQKQYKYDYSTKKGNMTVNRSDKSKGNFTACDNNIVLNKNLSSDAVRVMLTIFFLHPTDDLKQDKIVYLSGLSKDVVSNAFEELEFYKYIESIKHGAKKQFKVEYTVNEIPTQIINDKFISSRSLKRLEKKNVLHKQPVKDRAEKTACEIQDVESRNNNNINNKIKDNNILLENSLTLEQREKLQEIDNVDNNILEFANLQDIQLIQSKIDELFLSGNFDLRNGSTDKLKTQVKLIIKDFSIDKILNFINQFPLFLKTQKNKFPDKVYSDFESLNYFTILLKESCEYPKWFQDNLTETTKKQAVNDIENKYGYLWTIWKCIGSNSDQQNEMLLHNIFMCDNFLNRSKNNPKLLESEGFKTSFNQSIERSRKTISNESNIDIILQLFKDYLNKPNMPGDRLKANLNAFIGSNTIESKLLELIEKLNTVANTEVI